MTGKGMLVLCQTRRPLPPPPPRPRDLQVMVRRRKHPPPHPPNKAAQKTQPALRLKRRWGMQGQRMPKMASPMASGRRIRRKVERARLRDHTRRPLDQKLIDDFCQPTGVSYSASSSKFSFDALLQVCNYSLNEMLNMFFTGGVSSIAQICPAGLGQAQTAAGCCGSWSGERLDPRRNRRRRRFLTPRQRLSSAVVTSRRSFQQMPCPRFSRFSSASAPAL